MPKPLGRKIKYYRAFLATHEVRLEGVFAPTSIDGRRDLHARMAWDELVLGAGSASAKAGDEHRNWESGHEASNIVSAEPPLPQGMTIFNPVAYLAHALQEATKAPAPY